MRYFVLFLASGLWAQSQFMGAYGTCSYDEAWAVEDAPDGGFVLVGQTDSLGDPDVSSNIIITKLNPDGNVDWTTVLDCTDTTFLKAYAVARTSDDAFVLAGLHDLRAGETNAFMAKFDQGGGVLWTCSYGTVSPDTSFDAAFDVAETQDQAYVFVGRCENADTQGVYLNKLLADGSMDWATQLMAQDTTTTALLSAVDVCPTGEIMTAGGVKGLYSQNFCPMLQMFEIDGSMKYSVYIQYGQSAGDTSSIVYDMVQLDDSSVILVGRIQGPGQGSNDMLVMKARKYYTSGAQPPYWARAIGGTGSDWASAVTLTPDGTILVAGFTDSYGAGNTDVMVCALDQDGNLLWAKVMGDTANDYADAITTTPDGGFVVSGASYSYNLGSRDMLAIKFDDSHTTCQESVIDPGFTLLDTAVHVSVYYEDGTYNSWNIRNNWAPQPCTIGDFHDPCQDTMICTLSDINETRSLQPGVKIATGIGFLRIDVRSQTQAKLSVYDPSGRLVDVPFEGLLSPGTHQIFLGYLNPGVYLYRLKTEIGDKQAALVVR